jgi:cytochrome o ubiquinol oxidase subunit IV
MTEKLPHTTEASHGSLTTYVTGFMWSIILTLAAYVTVAYQIFPVRVAIGAIVALALVQLVIQLVFFLHLGRDAKPRWNFVLLIFAAVVIIILVFGSLWIMANLDYNMMPDHQIIERELPQY